jgi:leucyl/phenylalanyl-tRNA--protein transferase
MIDLNLLIRAYKMGFFPMADHGGQIRWFSPDPRGVIPLEGFKVPHGLRRTLNKGQFTITVNQSFPEVIRACAAREETWINRDIIDTYYELHRLGYAHSVEARLDGKLAGGLYGVALGGAFFGESMFHYATDASKVALFGLVERMKSRGFSLLDIQWTTPHLVTLGAVDLPQKEYLRMLEYSQKLQCRFVD